MAEPSWLEAIQVISAVGSPAITAAFFFGVLNQKLKNIEKGQAAAQAQHVRCLETHQADTRELHTRVTCLQDRVGHLEGASRAHQEAMGA